MGAAFGRPNLSRSTSQNNTCHANLSSDHVSPRSTFSVPSYKGASSVVKEIEKLRKSREERRARQNEQMQEKHEMMSRDAGNPNWEFKVMVDEYRHSLEFQPLQFDARDVPTNRICVCVRKRPLNSKEMSRKDIDVVTAPNKDSIIIHEPKTKVDLTKFLDNHKFRFDFAFNETTTNEMVYNYTAKALVQTIFEGGMATCFAYGQTGSGKTHTMGGDFVGKIQDYTKGIYALTAIDVFHLLESPKYKRLKLNVSASFFEIYCGKVYDLLNENTKLRILENGNQQIQVMGLVEQPVESVFQILEVIKKGSKSRSFSQSSCNDHSSRSHAVFQIILRKAGSKKIHGKFSLIDLAGNERGADAISNNRQRRMEGSEINKSLLALKECVRALGRKGSYLPFRASKLTQVLRDSFVGENIATCMIAMISPGMTSCEQTLNTLRYANRVKELSVQSVDVKLFRQSEAAQANDLERLQFLNENSSSISRILNGELSLDMCKFHETMSHLQELEDDVVENHKTLLEATNKWHDMDKILLTMTDKAGYNVELYSQQLHLLVREKITLLNQLNERISKLRNQLSFEETNKRNIRKLI